MARSLLYIVGNLVPNDTVTWGYHVAPLIVTRSNGKESGLISRTTCLSSLMTAQGEYDATLPTEFKPSVATDDEVGQCFKAFHQ
ncbi:MAG: hypothetical protein NTZ90_12070 [Proteobacteria bacterium]|nr:hypothetical protein [Pseudomonadota bacterium]